MIWIEVRLVDARDLPGLYFFADSLDCETIHHFYSEPWWPDGPVCRIQISSEGADRIRRRYALDEHREVHEWDASPDERAWGACWPLAAKFFEAASRIALTKSSGTLGEVRDRKLVHCALNAWGYSVNDEVRFSAKMLRGRLRVIRHNFSWRWFPLGRKNCSYGCHREWPTS